MEPRRTPRSHVELTVTLIRRRGRPVSGHTEDLATEGARVVVDRPLAVDEELRFDLICPDDRHVEGGARVVRQQRPDCYALRFETLDAPAREVLGAVVADTQ
jgi:PilZ domain-containing protein